jgi:hypothetical protein
MKLVMPDLDQDHEFEEAEGGEDQIEPNSQSHVSGMSVPNNLSSQHKNELRAAMDQRARNRGLQPPNMIGNK